MGIRRGRKHERVAAIFLGKIFNAVKTILGMKIMNKKSWKYSTCAYYQILILEVGNGKVVRSLSSTEQY